MAFGLIPKTVEKGRQFNKNVQLVQWNDFQVIEVLGRGQFGEVSKIKYKENIMSVKRHRERYAYPVKDDEGKVLKMTVQKENGSQVLLHKEAVLATKTSILLGRTHYC